MRILLLFTILLLMTAPSPGYAANQETSCEARFKSIQKSALSQSEPSKDELLVKLQALSPELTAAQVAVKIRESESPFFLFRSFVPAYYDSLKAEAEHFPEIKAARKETGWIFGDAHQENFGILLSDKGKGIFTINDYDDGARGPLIDDLVRFLAAAELNNPEEDKAALLKAYRAGLSNGNAPNSKIAKKLLEEGEAAGREPQKKYYDKDTKTLVRTKDASEAPAPTMDQLKTAVAKAYGSDAKLVDALEVARDNGGSGGLKRFRALIKVDEKEGTDKHHVLIEFKQMVDAAPARFSDLPQPSPKERLETSLKATQDGNPSRFYSVQSVDGKPMILRPRFAGNIGVALADYARKDASELILHEVGVLGKLHAGTVDSSSGYAKALKAVPDETLLALSHRIAETFRDYFRILKN